MKPETVLIDVMCYPEGSGERTSMLTAQHEPELLADGWLRFKTKDGRWHRLPPLAIKRVTEAPEPVVQRKPVKQQKLVP